MAKINERDITGEMRPPDSGSPPGLALTPVNLATFLGILGIGVAIIVIELLVFRDLRSNPGILALAMLTPLLAVLGTALARSGLLKRLPGVTKSVVRVALVVVVALDVIVLLLPMFIPGASVHDTRPQFVGSTTATSAPSQATSTPGTTANVPTPLQGMFDARPGGDTVSGMAILGQTTDGALLLRLQNFKATNGPDLFVYLTKTTAPTSNAGALEVAKLKAPQGDQNYPLPAGTDLGQYKSVLIWCKSFSVAFGFADLK